MSESLWRMTVELPWKKTTYDICERGQHALRWGFAEPWFQTEMFVAIDSATHTNGWHPIPMEVPYVTFGPVQLPKPRNRDWRTQGAVKWVDLCLHAVDQQTWCWVEFKIRATNNPAMAAKAARNARDAVRKDVVALMGFDAQRTSEIWKSPDPYTKAYWFEETLAPWSDQVRKGEHSFAVVYLQIGGDFDQQVWGQDPFQQAIREWWLYRSKHVAVPLEYPEMQVEYLEGLGAS